jgi:hypothetical protein
LQPLHFGDLLRYGMLHGGAGIHYREVIRNVLEDAAYKATVQARISQRAAYINLASTCLLLLALVIQVLWLRI